MNDKKKVDIIIPVQNRWEHTKQTLQSLFKHTNPDMYNLYVVNDASDSQTSKELENYLEERIELKEYFKNPESIGPGASRNNVAKYIGNHSLKSEYIYHSDNDVYFVDRWLETMLGMFILAEKENVILLGGGCHPYLQNKEAFNYHQVGRIIGIKDAVSGYSQLMRWETWEKYGPFDETMRNAEFKIMGSEDWAFCQRIVKDGFKVGSIEPEVVIATGKTNTYGKPATGSETFKIIPGVDIK